MNRYLTERVARTRSQGEVEGGTGRRKVDMEKMEHRRHCQIIYAQLLNFLAMISGDMRLLSLLIKSAHPFVASHKSASRLLSTTFIFLAKFLGSMIAPCSVFWICVCPLHSIPAVLASALEVFCI